MMELPLKGIIPPLVTPLSSSTTLDSKGLEKLIEHLINGGIHGLFILGSTGEATSLTYELRKELIKCTAEIVNHRIPVMAGITDTSIKGSLEIADYSAFMGIDSLVIAPPYYVPLSQEEMREYLENIVTRLPLPFLMYNMPAFTNMHMSIETIKRSKELGSIGVKDSSGDMSYLFSLIQEFKGSSEYSVFTGTELFLPETVLHGGHGAVAGGANLFPKLFVDLYNASVERDLPKIAVLRDLVLQLNNTIYNVGKHKSKIIKGIKCALSVMEMCDDYVAMPLKKFDIEEKKIIAGHIVYLNRIIQY